MNIEFNTWTLNVISFPKLGWEFNVHEVALSIGNFRIAWYGILIALGILLAMVYAFSQCKKFGVIDDKRMDAGLGGIIGGIVGARLYYVAFPGTATRITWPAFSSLGKGAWPFTAA